MVTRKKQPSRATATRSKRSHDVVVRMYNVGFGDSFLLRIPAAKRERKVLIDCGMHPSGPGPQKMAEVVRQIREDVQEPGGPRIDIVIATHRHVDHVSGFAETVWDDIEVGEVWMPWTEDPKDSRAREILERQSKVARKLAETTGLAPEILSMATNSLSNAEAMQTLHHGFAGDPIRCFLPGKDRAKASFTVDGVPGLTVHVLGPSRDPEMIRDMDPPEGESYLRVASQNDPRANERTPFDLGWALTDDEESNLGPVVRPSEVRALRNLGRVDELAVAVSLEKAVNGTSLMLVLQIGRAFFLFPGDAQWGTWQLAMDDPEWLALLRKTTFLKVSHHGSHNGTPRPLVTDVLGTTFCAMVSTRAHTGTWDIPRIPLLAALREKSPEVARSDVPERNESRRFQRDGTNFFTDVRIPF